MPGRFRRAVLTAVMVAMLAVTAGAPVSAGAVKLQISVGIGAFCVSGSGVPRAVHVVSLRTPDDELRSRFRREAGRQGRWLGCFNSVHGTPIFINAGDVIKVRVEGQKRRFTVPDIRPRTDRVGDVIRGRGPVGASIQVSVDRPGFTTDDPGVRRDVRVNGRGRWRLDLSDQYDIRGADGISVALADDGLHVSSNSFAPHIQLDAGGNVLSGAIDPGRTVSFRLVGGDGATRATASASEFFSGTYRVSLQDERGNAVYPRAGDRIESDIAGDGDLAIPDSFLRADASEDRIKARCMPHSEFELFTAGDDFRFFEGRTGDDGTLRRSADLGVGDFVELTCRYESGDQLRLVTDAGR